MKTGLFTDGLGDAYGPHYADLKVGDWVKIDWVKIVGTPQPAGEDLFGRIEGRDGLRWKVRCESGALWYAEGKHLALNVWATIDPAAQARAEGYVAGREEAQSRMKDAIDEACAALFTIEIDQRAALQAARLRINSAYRRAAAS